jgi:hypothetical protein
MLESDCKTCVIDAQNGKQKYVIFFSGIFDCHGLQIDYQFPFAKSINTTSCFRMRPYSLRQLDGLRKCSQLVMKLLQPHFFHFFALNYSGFCQVYFGNFWQQIV